MAPYNRLPSPRRGRAEGRRGVPGRGFAEAIVPAAPRSRPVRTNSLRVFNAHEFPLTRPSAGGSVPA